MKLPQTGRRPVRDINVRSVMAGVSRILMRYPVAIVLAIAALAFGMRLALLLHREEPPSYWCEKGLAAAYLGMLLSIALSALAAKRFPGRLAAAILQTVAVALAVLYYALLPDHYTVQALVRFILYALGLHFFIAFIILPEPAVLRYSRLVCIALLPLIVRLFIVIWKSMSVNGITELQYFELLLAVWLLFVAVYFSIFRRASIRWIPISLCIVAFLSSFGPWGVFAVSLHSQQQQLKEVLIKNKLFADGKVRKASAAVSLEDIQKISGIIRYIVEVHGYNALQPWYGENLDKLIAGAHKEGYEDVYTINRERAGILVKSMDIRYSNKYGLEDYGDLFFVRSYSDEADPVYIKGYDYLLARLFIRAPDTAGTSFRFGNYFFYARLDSATNHMTLSLRDGTPGRVTLPLKADSLLAVDLNPVVTAAVGLSTERSLQLPEAAMTVDAENRRWSCHLLLQHFNGIEREGRKAITEVSGSLLLRKK